MELLPRWVQRVRLFPGQPAPRASGTAGKRGAPGGGDAGRQAGLHGAMLLAPSRACGGAPGCVQDWLCTRGRHGAGWMCHPHKQRRQGQHAGGSRSSPRGLQRSCGAYAPTNAIPAAARRLLGAYSGGLHRPPCPVASHPCTHGFALLTPRRVCVCPRTRTDYKHTEAGEYLLSKGQPMVDW